MDDDQYHLLFGSSNSPEGLTAKQRDASRDTGDSSIGLRLTIELENSTHSSAGRTIGQLHDSLHSPAAASPLDPRRGLDRDASTDSAFILSKGGSNRSARSDKGWSWPSFSSSGVKGPASGKGTNHDSRRRFDLLFGQGQEHSIFDVERDATDSLLLENPSVFPSLSPGVRPTILGLGTLVLLIVGVILSPAEWLQPWAPKLFGVDNGDTAEIRVAVLKYLSIPVVSCLFTYFHIWLALFMMFYPLEFHGCAQLPEWTLMGNMGLPGWQGIVPYKSVKMISIATDMMLGRLINIKTEMAKVKPAVVAGILAPMLKSELEALYRDIALRHKPQLCQRLPLSVQQMVIARGLEQADLVAVAVIEDIQSHVDELLDVKALLTTHFTEHKALLSEIFIQCGYQELLFIRNNGGVLGFLFGIVQMVVCFFWHPAVEAPLHASVQALVVFPVFGLVVGALTNWLSLLAIFSPVEPIKLRCWCRDFVLHGLFLRRQREVSAVYARLVGTQVLLMPSLIHAMLHGTTVPSGPAKLQELMAKHFGNAFDSTVDAFPAILQSVGLNAANVLGADEVVAMRADAVERLLKVLPNAITHPAVLRYFESTIGIEVTMRERMADLPHADFESILHPVFQEDEWKLVLVGGMLGVFLGFLQAYFIN